MGRPNFLEANRRNWEERVPIHVRDATGCYNIEAFLAGRTTLGRIEAAELGDVGGRRILHLQCHIGLDTLSLVRCGAQATGLDFSLRAIDAARDLSRRTGLAATFVEGNVYDAATLAPGPFDIVYTTWGTVTWLPDVARWAQTIATIHPLSEIMSGLLAAGLQIEMLHEHELLPWKPFPMMVPAEGGYYRLPDGVPPIPLAVSLKARKSRL